MIFEHDKRNSEPGFLLRDSGSGCGNELNNHAIESDLLI